MTARSIVLFLIACCAHGQIETPPGCELINYGRQWKGWALDTRLVYLAGYVDGGADVSVALAKYLPPMQEANLRKELATIYDDDVLAAVMTSLYADPANTYITHGAMVYIARDKLNRKEITEALRDARMNKRAFTCKK